MNQEQIILMVVSGVAGLLISGNLFFWKRLITTLDKTATSVDSLDSAVLILTEKMQRMNEIVREVPELKTQVEVLNYRINMKTKPPSYKNSKD